MPWELDFALLSFTQLKKSKYYLDDNDIVYVDVTLNLSNYLIDWNSSKLTKDFFIEKFNSLQPLLNGYKCKFKIYDGNDLYGSLNTMKESTEPHIDHYMALNPDMYFTEHLLSLLIQASKIIHNKCFLISAQIPKLWDSSWDVITNERYLNIPYEDYIKIDPYDVRYNLKSNNSDISLISINTFKFAGWCDLYNKTFWKYFMTNEEWTGYGGCDYHAMLLSEIIKNRGCDIKQYILKNQIVCEYNFGDMFNTGYTNHYKKNLTLKKIENQREEFNKKLNYYINKNINRLIEDKIFQ